ncbi:phosphonate metabolism transcriptional regulator PhnF, partial [Vibrio sp.]|uniref:phosphonate metabolism transcriptional regulator PhnF n=1 Tax=Vibrio sp. TaxID=678 RepID=UPI003D0EEC02
FVIDRYSPEKIYMQIANAIETDLKDGFEAGDLYLSEKALTEKFGVNRHTVRRAVEELVKQNVLEKRHGFGTFVAEKRVAYSIKSHHRLSRAIAEKGSEVETHLLEKKRIPALGSVAEKLQLKNGDEVLQLDTLRKIDEKSIAVISHFFPVGIVNDAFDRYESGSLGSFLAKHCDIQAKRISSLVSASMPNAQDSFHLGMGSCQPILKVKTLNLDLKTNQLVEYSVTRFRGDMMQLELLME